MFIWNEELNMYIEAEEDSTEEDSSNKTTEDSTEEKTSNSEEDTKENKEEDNSEEDSTEEETSNSEEDSTEEETPSIDDNTSETDTTDDSSSDLNSTDENTLDENPEESYQRYGYLMKFEKMAQCINSLENKIENIKQNNNEEVQLLQSFIIKLRNDINYIQTDKITNIGVENLSKVYLVLVSKLELMTDMVESYYKKSDTEE